MTRDPVCGMNLQEYDATALSDYHGKTYYFCSTRCHTFFAEQPDSYAVDVLV